MKISKIVKIFSIFVVIYFSLQNIIWGIPMIDSTPNTINIPSNGIKNILLGINSLVIKYLFLTTIIYISFVLYFIFRRKIKYRTIHDSIDLKNYNQLNITETIKNSPPKYLKLKYILIYILYWIIIPISSALFFLAISNSSSYKISDKHLEYLSNIYIVLVIIIHLFVLFINFYRYATKKEQSIKNIIKKETSLQNTDYYLAKEIYSYAKTLGLLALVPTIINFSLILILFIGREYI